jgi:murein DD-endopeptidase MepM/ murein hydrolase activator NlpD
VITGGRSRLTNYHHNSPAAQNLAIDLVRDENNSPTEGQPVYAPATGTIETADDGYAPGSGPAEGNLIIIKTADNTDIWLAHLQQDSLTVIAGQPVTAGTAIARTGRSGSATIPHLHIHAQQNGHPIPILWKPKNQYLVRGDVITFPHP